MTEGFFSRQTWFTQSSVNDLKRAGLNTVRIPVCDYMSAVTALFTDPDFSLGTGSWSHWSTVRQSIMRRAVF